MEIFFENLGSLCGFEMESSIASFWCITLVPSMRQCRVEVKQLLRGVWRLILFFFSRIGNYWKDFFLRVS